MAHHSDYQIDLRKPPQVAEEAGSTVSEVPAATRSSFTYKVAAYALLFVMLFSPVARVFADEGAVEVVTTTTTPESPTVEALIVPEPVAEEVVAGEEGTASTDESASEELGSVVDQEDVSELPITGEEVSEENTDEDALTEETTDSTPEEGEVLSEATSTPEAVVEEQVEEEEGISEEVTPEIVYVDRPASVDPSKILFNTTDCVTVNDGEFYCIKKQNADSIVRKEATPTRSVLAQKDGDGDLEIYLSEEGVTKQITSNTTDDDAPSYDSTTGMIAWHALVNERYQIFLYSPKTQGIIQLTNTDFNNTNPSLDGTLLSWQAWEDGNWEIFYTQLSDSLSEESLPESIRVSRNSEPDMFPKSYSQFITWQARVADSWRTRGFNVTTGEYSDLGEGTGGDISSARLVLLVERRGENGVVERVGYEVETGEEIPLGTSATPAPLSSIPESPIDGTSGSIPETNVGNALKTASRVDGDTDGDGNSDEVTE